MTLVVATAALPNGIPAHRLTGPKGRDMGDEMDSSFAYPVSSLPQTITCSVGGNSAGWRNGFSWWFKYRTVTEAQRAFIDYEIVWEPGPDGDIGTVHDNTWYRRFFDASALGRLMRLMTAPPHQCDYNGVHHRTHAPVILIGTAPDISGAIADIAPIPAVTVTWASSSDSSLSSLADAVEGPWNDLVTATTTFHNAMQTIGVAAALQTYGPTLEAARWAYRDPALAYFNAVRQAVVPRLVALRSATP